MYNVQVTSLIGRPQVDGWAHVIVSPNRQSVWVLAVAGDHARNVGKDVLDLLQPEKLDVTTDPAAVYQLILDVIHDVDDKDCDISLATLIVGEAKHTYFAVNGSILLRREGKFGVLLKGVEHNVPASIQGKHQPDDIFVLTTKQGLQFENEISIKLEQGFAPSRIVPSLESAAQFENKTALSAVALLSIEEGQQPVAEEPTQPEPIVFPPSETEIPKVEQPAEPPAPVSRQSLREPEATNQPSEERQAALTTAPQQAATTKADLFSQKPPNPSLEKKDDPESEDIKLFISGKKIANDIQSWFKKQLHRVVSVFKSIPQLLGKIRTMPWKSFVPQLRSRHVYVRQNWQRKVAQIIAVVVLIAAAAAAGIWYYNWQRQQAIIAVREQVAPTLEAFETAQGQAESQPLAARDTAATTREELETTLQTLPENSPALGYLEAQLAIVNEFYESLANREELSELPIAFELREQIDDFVVTQSGLTEGQLFFLDGQSGSVILVDPETGERTQQSYELSAPVRDASAREETSQIWLLSDNVTQIRPTSDANTNQLIASSDTVTTGTQLSAFGTSAYLLSPKDRDIYRYAIDEDGNASEATSWVRSAPGIEFDTISSMIIDGDIWLATQNGEIFNLRSGNLQDFEVTGLEEPFTGVLQLFTTGESDFLYVLEPSQRRLVRLNKDGTFDREYTSASLASVVSFVIDEPAAIGYAASGSLVYRLEL